MNAKLCFVILSIRIIQFVCAHPGTGTGPDDKTTLSFKVSARGLDDKDPLGTSDSYVTITYSDGNGKDEKQIGLSAIQINEENPDWGDVFTFEWDRRQNQRWHFVVYDHDTIRHRDDDTLGYVWVTVNDYVDKHQYLEVNLVKKGCLIIQKV